jgi:decaprenylphospho-beta-D-erythro-pentofuranosid-2-ulose 2-reductase
VIDALGMPQSAVVLGGTSDIARAILGRLAARRLQRVLLAGRDDARLEEACRELRALGVGSVHKAAWDATDTDPDVHRRLADMSAQLLGEVDLVVVAAGTLGDQTESETDPRAAVRVVTTNFTGPLAAMVAFADLMRSQGQGRFVVLSSVAGVRTRRSNFVYGASKAGLDGFAQGLSYALEPEGVGVTIVRPGWVASRMTTGLRPAPMATTPEAVAADVVRGLERGSRCVWSPAGLRIAFAVMRLLPSSVWKRLPG